MSKLCFMVVLSSLVAGCGKPIPENVRGCYGDGCAIVTTSKYNPDFTGIGTLHTIKFPERTVTANIDATLDPDVALDIHDDKLFVLNRNVGSIRRYDIATFVIEAEIPLGTTEAPGPLSSPRDFVFDELNAWISFGSNQSKNAIGVVDMTTGKGISKYISIPTAAADPDGSPEPADLYSCKGRLYVALQDYTFDGGAFRYTGPGRIAIIDMAQQTLLSVFTLTGKNPSQILAAGGDCEQALVITSSDLTKVPDGSAGIERVDLAAGKSLGFLTRDLDIDGRPFAAERISDSLMLTAVYSDPQLGQDGKIYLASAKVISVDPSTGKKITDITDKAGFINFLSLSPDKQLFVGVGQFFDMPEAGKLTKGLYVGPADGSHMPSSGMDLGQTPSGIAFHTL